VKEKSLCIQRKLSHMCVYCIQIALIMAHSPLLDFRDINVLSRSYRFYKRFGIIDISAMSTISTSGSASNLIPETFDGIDLDEISYHRQCDQQFIRIKIDR
jgi:hypothetical protein